MNQPSILIVEDQPHSRELLGTFLAQRGYRVDLAPDGETALALMRQSRRPTLVLLDLHLPGMNGWQVRSAMLSDPKLAEIPVVVTSGATSETPPPFGITELMSKPLDLRALLELLDRHCGRRGHAA